MLTFLCFSLSFLQIGSPAAEPILGARWPAISPDGSKVAFQYRGDIWMVSTSGGTATRVTNHVELDTRPIWSPDGAWIAFTSDRNGNNDVFAIPASGGDVRQITYSGFNETATGWSPDGRYIVFTGGRDTPWSGIFVVDVRSLRFKMITEDYQGLSNPRFSPDGKTIVAQRMGFPWTRPRYYGSAAAQVVLVDVSTGGMKRLIDNQKQNFWPAFTADGKGIYVVTYGDVTPSTRNINEPPSKFVDSQSRTPNIWLFDLNGRGRQVTEYVGEPVRYFSVARDGSIAFEREGRIYVKRGEQVRLLDIIVHGDAKLNTTERQVLTGGASEARISPDGKTFLFVAGAEVWTVPLEKPSGRNKDDAERMTDYPGFDGEAIWSKDGKSVYFISDRDFNRRLFSMDVATKQLSPIWTGMDDALSPELSPDGKMLAFWVAGPNGGLYLWETSGSASPRRLFFQPGTHFFGVSAGEFEWSPDSRWIALTRRQPGDTWNVWIVNVGDGKAVNVTERNVDHGALGWSADGKYLYFRSSREGGGFFILPLQVEEEDPQEAEMKYQKVKEDVRVEIDFRDISRRVRKFFSQSPDSNVVSNKETGRIYFLSGGGMWVADYDGKNAKRVVEGVASFTLSEDGKTAFGLRSGVPVKIGLGDNYPVTEVAFRAELIQDSDLVRKAAFTEFWRMYNRGFYDGNFHGRNWEAIRRRYEPLLLGVGHRKEFAELLNLMVGELEASHTEVGPAPGGIQGPAVALPGFMFDYSYEGPGIRVKGLFDTAPGTYKKTEIKPGEYVLAINGVDVTLDENLWKVLHNQHGRNLVFLVNSTPSKEGARTVKYRGLSSGEWGEMHYKQWVEGNRRKVEEVSGGKIGYVHIRGMGGNDRVRFEEEFHEYKQGKDAMIIDVRFNGGGNISDSLVDVLERKPHGFYQPRDGWIEPAPNSQVWDKPIVVLHNENSFSNAEMFPYAMRARGLATLVGMPTSGYVIWTWGGRLVDGTSIRMPMSGVYRLDGSPMENLGQQPDIRIPWTNEDFFAGKDPQLERAIQELMSKVK